MRNRGLTFYKRYLGTASMTSVIGAMRPKSEKAMWGDESTEGSDVVKCKALAA